MNKIQKDYAFQNNRERLREIFYVTVRHYQFSFRKIKFFRKLKSQAIK